MGDRKFVSLAFSRPIRILSSRAALHRSYFQFDRKVFRLAPVGSTMTPMMTSIQDSKRQKAGCGRESHSVRTAAAHIARMIAQLAQVATYQSVQPTYIQDEQQSTPGSCNASVSLFLLVCLALIGRRVLTVKPHHTTPKIPQQQHNTVQQNMQYRESCCASRDRLDPQYNSKTENERRML